MDEWIGGLMSLNTPQPKVNGAELASAPAAPAQVLTRLPGTAPEDGRAQVVPPAGTPPPLPNPLSHLPFPFKGVDYAAKGYHVEATVAPDHGLAVAEALDMEGLALDTITGVDWMAEGQFEVVYDYFNPRKALRVVVRTRIPRDNPEVPTIHKVFPGANWHERETHDFFGIRFVGHPNLTPFLLPEDADYHPLRKDYTA